MKRKLFLIGATLVVFVLAVWRGCHSEPADAPPNQPAPPAPREVRTSTPKANTTNPQEDYEKSVAEKGRQFANEMNESIEYFGRVIDQDGKPLKDVVVSYRVRSVHTTPVQWGPDEISNGVTHTDGDGRFSIKGHAGFSLSFSLAKNGYREWGGGASYGRNSAERHRPDLSNPVQFTLIRDDLPQAEKVHEKILSFVWNTGPVKVDCGPKVGSLILTPKRNCMNPADKRQTFDWSVDVQSLGFGMAHLAEKSPKVAPVDDYQTASHYGYSRESKEWRTRVTNCYAIRTTDGKFGIMVMQLFGDGEEKGVCGSLAIYLNQSGARNIDHK
jgi:hypothetical protein